MSGANIYRIAIGICALCALVFGWRYVCMRAACAMALRRPSVYVAGGSHERLEVRRWIDELVRRGARITFDWTRAPEWDLGRDITPDERRWVADLDLAAVLQARIVWVLLPRQLSEGAATELGAALAARALGHPVLIVASGSIDGQRIFAALADVVVPTHGDGLRVVLDMLSQTSQNGLRRCAENWNAKRK